MRDTSCVVTPVCSHRGKVFLEQAVDKDIAAADFTEEDTVGAVVEEAHKVPRSTTSAIEEVAENKMEDNCPSSSINQPKS